jgi:hypothetical protein
MLVPKDLKEISGLKVIRVSREMLVPKVPREFKASREMPVPRALKAQASIPFQTQLTTECLPLMALQTQLSLNQTSTLMVLF